MSGTMCVLRLMGYGEVKRRTRWKWSGGQPAAASASFAFHGFCELKSVLCLKRANAMMTAEIHPL
jgi:hypothetical protein